MAFVAEKAEEETEEEYHFFEFSDFVVTSSPHDEPDTNNILVTVQTEYHEPENFLIVESPENICLASYDSEVGNYLQTVFILYFILLILSLLVYVWKFSPKKRKSKYNCKPPPLILKSLVLLENFHCKAEDIFQIALINTNELTDWTKADSNERALKRFQIELNRQWAIAESYFHNLTLTKVRSQRDDIQHALECLPSLSRLVELKAEVCDMQSAVEQETFNYLSSQTALRRHIASKLRKNATSVLISEEENLINAIAYYESIFDGGHEAPEYWSNCTRLQQIQRDSDKLDSDDHNALLQIVVGNIQACARKDFEASSLEILRATREMNAEFERRKERRRRERDAIRRHAVTESYAEIRRWQDAAREYALLIDTRSQQREKAKAHDLTNMDKLTSELMKLFNESKLQQNGSDVFLWMVGLFLCFIGYSFASTNCKSRNNVIHWVTAESLRLCEYFAASKRPYNLFMRDRFEISQSTVSNDFRVMTSLTRATIAAMNKFKISIKNWFLSILAQIDAPISVDLLFCLTRLLFYFASPILTSIIISFLPFGLSRWAPWVAIIGALATVHDVVVDLYFNNSSLWILVSVHTTMCILLYMFDQQRVAWLIRIPISLKRSLRIDCRWALIYVLYPSFLWFAACLTGCTETQPKSGGLKLSENCGIGELYFDCFRILFIDHHCRTADC